MKLKYIRRIEAAMMKIYNDASNGLRILNEKQIKTEESIRKSEDFPTGMYSPQCDEQYYRNVARFAWAYRAKHIAMLELQGTINEIKKELIMSLRPEKVYSPVLDEGITKKDSTEISDSQIWESCYTEDEYQDYLDKHKVMYCYHMKFEGMKPIQVTRLERLK